MSSLDMASAVMNKLYHSIQIRNGNFWAIGRDEGTVVHARTALIDNVRSFPGVLGVTHLFVSDSGRICLALGTKIHLLRDNFNRSLLNLPPGVTITSAAFTDSLIFMGTESGEIFYCQLNVKSGSGISHLPLPNFQSWGEIRSLSAVQYSPNLIGLSVVTNNAIVPMILEDLFVNPRDSNPDNNTFRISDLKGVQTTATMMVVWYKSQFLFWRFPDEPNYQKSIKIIEIPETPSSFCLAGDFVLTLRGRASIDIYDHNGFIDSLDAPGVKQLVADGANVYLISDNGISNFRWDGNFLMNLFYKSAQKGANETATRILMKMGMTFQEIMRILKPFPVVKLHLCMKMLAMCHLVPQKRALALLIVDTYVRIEVSKDNPDVSGFCRLCDRLFRDELVSKRVVIESLMNYGWDKPIERLADPVTVHCCCRDDDLLIKRLSELSDDELSRAAFRISEKSSCKVLLQRGRFGSGWMIPLLMSDSFSSHIRELQVRIQARDHLNRIYSLSLAKNPDKNLVAAFFRNFCSEDLHFLMRSLVANKQFLMLAYGIASTGDWMKAAMTACKESPSVALEFIPSDAPNDMKQLCVSSILRAIPSFEAAKLAKHLMSQSHSACLDLSLLMKYLPRESRVADLEDTLSEFIAENGRRVDNQQRRTAESLAGTELQRQKLSHSSIDSLSSVAVQHCYRCRTTLFLEHGTLYPCGHAVHSHCAREIASEIGVAERDVALSCPFCGILSVRAIDAPFATTEEQDREWSVLPAPKKKTLTKKAATMNSLIRPRQPQFA